MSLSILSRVSRIPPPSFRDVSVTAIRPFLNPVTFLLLSFRSSPFDSFVWSRFHRLLIFFPLEEIPLTFLRGHSSDDRFFQFCLGRKAFASTLIFQGIFLKKNSSRFTAKLRGRHRDFPCPAYPLPGTTSPILTPPTRWSISYHGACIDTSSPSQVHS